MVKFTVKCPVIVFTQTAHAVSQVVTDLLRKPVLSSPLESDIGKNWDMSEIATEYGLLSLHHTSNMR